MGPLPYKIFFIIIVTTGCAWKGSKNPNYSSVNFFDPMNIGRFDSSRNLIIHALFRECGEWGGHEEDIIVWADDNSNFYARYLVYEFNCDSAMNKGFSRKLGIQKAQTTTLNRYKQAAIMAYIHQLTNAKILQAGITGQASHYFSVALSDSSLLIQERHGNSNINDHYSKLVWKLFKINGGIPMHQK